MGRAWEGSTIHNPLLNPPHKGEEKYQPCKKQTFLSRKLRNNLTDAEKHLWYMLRAENLGHKFRRQEPIGNYIVDFVCYERKIIIEIDGGQHDGKKNDTIRDAWFRSQGFTILRFWNNEILENREAVVEKIINVLSSFPFRRFAIALASVEMEKVRKR